MFAEIDKQQVARQFSRAAAHYDQAAIIQQQMSEQLIAIYLQTLQSKAIAEPRRIIDLGCGTARSLKKLHELFPQAQLTGIDISQNMLEQAKKSVPSASYIQADMENYSCAQPIDLALSNASIQWCNLDQVLHSAYKSLTPSGIFAYSTFGANTHTELAQAWQASKSRHNHTIDFLCVDEHKIALDQAGYDILKLRTELFQPQFSSAKSLLSSIKKTGATNAIINRGKGMLGRQKYLSFLNHLSKQNPLQLSYEAITIIARKRS